MHKALPEDILLSWPYNPRQPMLPPRVILAAVTFSETSRVELALAARLARHCGADLHVLYVEDPLLDAAARHAGIDLGRSTQRELQRFAADAWPAALCSPHTHVVAGAAVDVILEVAHRQGADLIVVDGGRISGAEKLLFGSTTEGLLRRADVSLLVAPAEWRPPQPDAADLSNLGPVIAIVDMSDQPSVAASKAARELASVLGTSVEIVQVVPDAEMPAGLTNRLAEAAGQGADRAPMIVLGKNTPILKHARAGALVNRVLAGGTVPILLYVAEQIAQL
jgi:nucleotide-binding universal stress UspA family protein